MFFKISLAVFLAVAVSGSPVNERIIGGTEAREGEIPYIVSIRRGNSIICGGSIIDKNHILTAAHCVSGYENRPELFKILYGVVDKFAQRNLVQVESIKPHEGFHMFAGVGLNDIAVLKLESDIVFSNNAQPAVLPTRDLTITGTSVNSILAGWGRIEDGSSPRYLLKTEFPLFNDAECLKYMQGLYDGRYQHCAGSLDGTHKQCSGDSGGPLYSNGVQVGVVSWSNKPCTIAGSPGVFTKVFSYVDWIQNQVDTM